MTLLASIPSLSMNLRASINRNLNDIVELHEEILGDLHRVVPHSEYTLPDYNLPTLSPPSNGHHRWQSLDAVPENTNSLSWLQKVPGMTAEPNVAAEVARVFGNKVKCSGSQKKCFVHNLFTAESFLRVRRIWREIRIDDEGYCCYVQDNATMGGLPEGLRSISIFSCFY